MVRVLIVEDDIELATRIRDWLLFEKFEIETVDNGADALKCLKADKYDLVILDWMIPEPNGVEVLKQYRDWGGIAPVLMLTARTHVNDKTKGLDLGADDYLTKPFDVRELSARIRTLLRRPATYVGPVIKAGNLVLDSVNRQVHRDGIEVTLPGLEFDLLAFFMRHPNQVFSADAILNEVWSAQSESSPAALRTCLKTLRRKIEGQEKDSYIRNVHGLGYKFEPPHQKETEN